MLILTLFAFLAGIVTILSPCILPILPIMLSGSVGEGKKKPFGIVIGFIASFTFFTLFLSTLVQTFNIPADTLRSFSIFIIILFGITLIIPQAQLIFEKIVSFTGKFSPQGNPSGFLGGLLIGLSLGLIWTPCVGPILASVISLALTNSITGNALIITLAYSIGTAIPMLAVIYGGRELLQKVPLLSNNTTKIQRGFGVVMVLVGLSIWLNLDRKFQTFILTTFPNYGIGLTSLENNTVVKQQLDQLLKNNNSLLFAQKSPKAPDFNGGTNWINSLPLTLTDLKGKVVLVDFWTYSCINCIRTLPYLTKWYETYKDKGFVIIGVHSPEFEFEKNTANVTQAIKDFGITYPIVQDNNFTIWRSYENRYWPAHYLIDKEGLIRFTHFGEGKYQETENKIRELLGETPLKEINSEDESFRMLYQTPETYLGYSQANSYANTLIKKDAVATYDLESSLDSDQVGLKGTWQVNNEHILSIENNAELHLNFTANKVYLVLGKTTTSINPKVKILLDNQLINEIQISNPKKYDILDQTNSGQSHLLTLIFDKGIQAYAFTFGQ